MSSGFVIFLIISLIGYVFNKINESKEEQKKASSKQMPPMSQGPSGKTKKPIKQVSRSLEDYAAKVAKEIERQAKELTNQQKPTPKTIERQFTEAVERVESASSRDSLAPRDLNKALEERQSSRPSLGRDSSILSGQSDFNGDEQKTSSVRKKQTARGFVPSTTEGMARAIVMSEILSPPVSRRRK